MSPATCACAAQPPGRMVRAVHARVRSGWLALVFALCSPLDTLAAALFSAHMVQHETMMLIAAPLLVIGRPLAVWMWAFPRRCAPPSAARCAHAGFARRGDADGAARRMAAACGGAVGLARAGDFRGRARASLHPYTAARELSAERAALLVDRIRHTRAARQRARDAVALHDDGPYGRARRVAHACAGALVSVVCRARARSASIRCRTSSSADSSCGCRAVLPI